MNQCADQESAPSVSQSVTQSVTQSTTWWQSLVGTALVGTDRQSPTVPTGESPVETVVRQLDWQQPEAALLKTAGVFAAYWQVGQDATTDAERVELAPLSLAEPDDRPSCSPRIAEHLRVGLNRYPQAIAELLSLIASAKQRIPYRLMPSVLRYGENDVRSQPLLEAVIGNRGRWLAAQNADWHYISTRLGEISSTDITRWQLQWQTGNRSQRLLVMQQWRRLDPEGAREAIAATWSTESRQIRSALIELFGLDSSGHQLSMADEPFLEAALTDRTQAVRQAAAKWLARLPESRLSERMANRAQQFVHLQGTKNGLELSITLPDAFDTDWLQDGIRKAASNGLSEQASWLQQLLAKTPLTVWQSQLGTAGIEGLNDTLSSTTTADSTRKILIHGWAQAICNQRQYDYARQWVPVLLNQLDAYDWDKDVLSTMLSLLPPQQTEVYLRDQVPAKVNDQSSAYWLKIVAQSAHQSEQKWDYDFSRLVLTQLVQVMKSKYRYGDLFSPPASLALALHPGLAAEAQRAIESVTYGQRPTKAWQRFLDEFLGVLNYRWQMYQLFADSG